ncbi:MAG: helix-turn-helix transcriptional regulator [Pseudonocardia sp.]
MSTKRPGLSDARKAAGHTQESLAEALEVDRSTVVRWEAGETAPQPWLRPKLAHALDISRQALADLLSKSTVSDKVVSASQFLVEEVEAVLRRAFVGAGAVATFEEVLLGPVIDFINPAIALSVPSRVGQSDLDRIRMLNALGRQMDTAHGGGSCADLLTSQLPTATRLLHATMSDTMRSALFTAVADAYLVAGWAQADTGDLDTARALLSRGLRLAREAEEASLVATILTFQAHLYGSEKEAHNMLRLTQLAETVAPHHLSRSNAVIHQAWGYAQLGNRQAADHVTRSQDLYSHNWAAAENETVPWLHNFSEYGPVGLVEATYRELSAHDSRALERAVPASLKAIPPAPGRRALIATSRAAELHLRAGESSQGLQLAETAVTMSAADNSWTRSPRARKVLVDLKMALRPVQDPTAAELVHQLDTP